MEKDFLEKAQKKCIYIVRRVENHNTQNSQKISSSGETKKKRLRTIGVRTTTKHLKTYFLRRKYFIKKYLLRLEMRRKGG